MPVQSPPLQSTKNRSLPIGPDGDGMAVNSPAELELLQAILTELQQIRLVLSMGLEVDIEESDGE